LKFEGKIYTWYLERDDTSTNHLKTKKRQIVVSDIATSVRLGKIT